MTASTSRLVGVLVGVLARDRNTESPERALRVMKSQHAWKHDRVVLNVSLTLVSLVEEENVLHTNALQLASHLRDLFAHVCRH